MCTESAIDSMSNDENLSHFPILPPTLAKLAKRGRKKATMGNGQSFPLQDDAPSSKLVFAPTPAQWDGKATALSCNKPIATGGDSGLIPFILSS